MGMNSQQSSGSTSSKVDPRAWALIQPMLDRGLATMNQGYVPYQGYELAANTPLQNQAIQGASDWNTAFNNPSALVGGHGADVLSGQPQPTTDPVTGVSGFSSYQGYQDQLAKLQSAYPGLYKYIQSFAIDPVTGAPGSRSTPPGSGTGQGTGGQSASMSQMANWLGGGRMGGGFDTAMGPFTAPNMNLNTGGNSR